MIFFVASLLPPPLTFPLLSSLNTCSPDYFLLLLLRSRREDPTREKHFRFPQSIPREILACPVGAHIPGIPAGHMPRGGGGGRRHSFVAAADVVVGCVLTRVSRQRSQTRKGRNNDFVSPSLTKERRRKHTKNLITA